MVERAKNARRRRWRSPWWASMSALHDAYLSVVEALTHGGIENDVKVDIRWVDSETRHRRQRRRSCSAACDGVLVPGGFGDRGIEGMISAVRYARETQRALFRHLPGDADGGGGVCPPRAGLADAHSSELGQTTAPPGHRPDARPAGRHRQGRHHASGRAIPAA